MPTSKPRRRKQTAATRLALHRRLVARYPAIFPPTWRTVIASGRYPTNDEFDTAIIEHIDVDAERRLLAMAEDSRPECDRRDDAWHAAVYAMAISIVKNDSGPPSRLENFLLDALPAYVDQRKTQGAATLRP